MSEEIKNILEKAAPYLFGDENEKLYNYIINLQKENEELKKISEVYDRKYRECKMLKEQILYEKENTKVYKSRNDKAINFIKNNYIEEYPNEDILLNILQGGDEE